jgi:uncharacterized protein YdaU (DUF1376 family)
MAEFPVLPIFTDAYLADTRHLTAAQHGAYLLLLMSAWRTKDCALPNDDNFLSRCAAMDMRTWKANKDVVMAFWRLDETQKFRQARLTDERKNADNIRNRNVQAGIASALKRKERHSTGVATKTLQSVNKTSTPLNPSLKSISSEAKASSDIPRNASPPNALGENQRPEPNEPSAKKTKKPKKTALRPMPEGWRPNDEHREKCKELGFDADKLADELNGFINYHRSKGSKFSDWDRAFWTWIGNAQRFNHERKEAFSARNKSSNPSIAEVGLRVAARYQNAV